MEVIHKSFKNRIRNDIHDLNQPFFNENFLRKSLSMLYHENSKFTKFELRKLATKIAPFSTQYIKERASQPYKDHPSSKKISIKKYEATNLKIDLFHTILSRRSRRAFQEYSIPLDEICKLLYFSYGITGKETMDENGHCFHLRAVPSGGGLYPLEVYLYINNGTISNGLYHYRPDISSIELIKEGEQINNIKDFVYAEPIVDITRCSCIIFVTSVFSRTLLKYGDRGYRFILKEVGFLSQNTSLICEGLGLSSCMVGGYIDNKVNDLLMVDGSIETIQNIIVIGKA